MTSSNDFLTENLNMAIFSFFLKKNVYAIQ